MPYINSGLHAIMCTNSTTFWEICLSGCEGLFQSHTSAFFFRASQIIIYNSQNVPNASLSLVWLSELSMVLTSTKFLFFISHISRYYDPDVEFVTKIAILKKFDKFHVCNSPEMKCNDSCSGRKNSCCVH